MRIIMPVPNAYRVGETVTINGWYVCVPCGYKAHLKAGDLFPSCINCMRVSHPFSDAELDTAAAEGVEIDEFDDEAVAPNMELWELTRRDHRAV